VRRDDGLTWRGSINRCDRYVGLLHPTQSMTTASRPNPRREGWSSHRSVEQWETEKKMAILSTDGLGLSLEEEVKDEGW
jgi:hypothetical protein